VKVGIKAWISSCQNFISIGQVSYQRICILHAKKFENALQFQKQCPPWNDLKISIKVDLLRLKNIMLSKLQLSTSSILHKNLYFPWNSKLFPIWVRPWPTQKAVIKIKYIRLELHLAKISALWLMYRTKFEETSENTPYFQKTQLCPTTKFSMKIDYIYGSNIMLPELQLSTSSILPKNLYLKPLPNLTGLYKIGTMTGILCCRNFNSLAQISYRTICILHLSKFKNDSWL